MKSIQKILVSWIALDKDFINGQVNEDGPTANLYKHLFKYDCHYLLSQSSEKKGDTKLDFLINYLKRKFSYQVEPCFMNMVSSP